LLSSPNNALRDMNLGVNWRMFTATSLIPRTTYQVTVSFNNQIGSSGTSVISITTFGLPCK